MAPTREAVITPGYLAPAVAFLSHIFGWTLIPFTKLSAVTRYQVVVAVAPFPGAPPPAPLTDRLEAAGVPQFLYRSDASDPETEMARLAGSMEAAALKLTTRDRPKVGVVVPSRRTGPHSALPVRATWSAFPVPTVLVRTGDGTEPKADLNARGVVMWLPGAGASGARNAGMAALPEDLEWVWFLDDDDALRAGWQAALTEAGGVDVVIGAAFSTDPRHAGPIPPETPYTSQIAWRRELLEHLRGFNPAHPIGEERELLRRCEAAGARIRRTTLVVAYKGGEDPSERPALVPTPMAPLPPAQRGGQRFHPRF